MPEEPRRAGDGASCISDTVAGLFYSKKRVLESELSFPKAQVKPLAAVLETVPREKRKGVEQLEQAVAPSLLRTNT